MERYAITAEPEELVIEKDKNQQFSETVGDVPYSLVLFNDDVNSLDHVIDCLVKYCKHTSEQAVQCAYITHYKGKCQVKSGSMEKLRPIHEAMLENSLTTKIM